jgi:hypothetical protein
MTARTAVRRKTLAIAELYDQPPLMPLWPDLGAGVLGWSESTTYEAAARNELPVELVRVGRRRYARTADVLAWLHLPQNDDGARDAAPAPSVEHAIESTSKQIGTHS